jgi:hypothetical protein
LKPIRAGSLLPCRTGISPCTSPDREGGTPAHELVGDLRSRVADADDEDAAVTELLRGAVLARVELDDPRIELGREVGIREW